MDDRTRNSMRGLHGPYRYMRVPSEVYGAALTTFLANKVLVPGASVRGLLQRFAEFWKATAPNRASTDVELAFGQSPTLAAPISQHAEIFDWATETLKRTAVVAEETVAARRRTLREMAKVERRIGRTQADTSRLLSRLTKGAAKA